MSFLAALFASEIKRKMMPRIMDELEKDMQPKYTVVVFPAVDGKEDDA